MRFLEKSSKLAIQRENNSPIKLVYRCRLHIDYEIAVRIVSQLPASQVFNFQYRPILTTRTKLPEMEAAIDSSVRRAFGITDIHLNINGIFDGVGRDRLGNGDKNLVHLRYNKWQIYELNSEGNPNPTIDIQNPILSQLFTWELIPIDTDGPIVPNDEPPPGYGP